MQEEADVAENDEADEMPEVQETVAVIPGSTLLWRVCPRPPHSAEVHTHTHHIEHLSLLLILTHHIDRPHAPSYLSADV